MAQELSFVTLDVFTTKRFAGNPLAVIRVPANVTLAQETKQLIAREFNFSETVFLHAGGSAGSGEPGGGRHRVDIFTTTEELPFAGHPTIGSASLVLSEQKEGTSSSTLVIKAGDIPVQLIEDQERERERGDGLGFVRASVPHDVHVHQKTLRSLDAQGLQTILDSKALGYGNKDIEQAELDAPVVSIVKGMTFLLVRLANLAQLAQVRSTGPSVDLGRVEGLLDQGPWEKSFVGRYYYVLDKDEKDQKDQKDQKTTTLRSRMIADGLEDPATGSAATALGSYLALQAASSSASSSSGPFRYEIVQGVEMGRRSEILVEVELADNNKSVKTVYLGGSAVQVTTGTIRT